MADHPELGNRWIDLRLWPGRPLAGGGPLWAALCGLIASGELKWEAELALTSGLALFLAAPMWGAVWQAVAATDWFTPFSAAQRAIAGPWLTLLPYTAPGSPAGRLAEGLGRAKVWWQERFWPRYGEAFIQLAVALPLSLGVASIIGRSALVLTVTVWALATLALIVDRGAGTPPVELQAIVQGGLAWLLGHAVLSELTWPSAAMAVAFAVSGGAALALATGRRSALAWLNGGQTAAIVLLVSAGHPLPAALIALLLLPQLYLQAYLHRDGDVQWYLRRTQPLVMAVMFLAALAI